MGGAYETLGCPSLGWSLLLAEYSGVLWGRLWVEVPWPHPVLSPPLRQALVALRRVLLAQFSAFPFNGADLYEELKTSTAILSTGIGRFVYVLGEEGERLEDMAASCLAFDA